MTITFVRHRVADYDAWRRVYRTEGDPNDVLVMHRFGSPDEAHAFLEDPDLRNAVVDAGVDIGSVRVEFYEGA